MPEYFGNTNLQINGTGIQFMTKEYLIDAYPSLVNNFKTPGLWTWGYNDWGQLGTNDTTSRSSPVQTILAVSDWKKIGAGRNHSGAIKTDGTLWMWGLGGNGQLGNNSILSRSSPVQTVSGGTNWKQVSGGYDHTAAIKTDGTLWTWGYNYNGALGDNTQITRSSPVQTVSAGTNWKQLACGFENTGAIKTDGTLWLWGGNSYGQLGDNTNIRKSSPVQTVSAGSNWKQVSCGSSHAGAIKTDGTLWMWGRNYYGSLGINTSKNNISSPVQIFGGGTNWKQVSCGTDITGAIKTDGTLWMWGANYGGQLGNNNGKVFSVSSPVQTISAGTNWKEVSAGADIVASIKTDGTLWLWGFSYYGQLGIGISGNGSYRSSPVQTISGGTNWKQVTCGSATGSLHILALRDDSADPFRLDYL